MALFARWWPKTGARQTALAAGLVVLGGLVPVLWDILYGQGFQALRSSPKSLALLLLGLGLLQGWWRARRAIRDLLVVVLPLASIFCTIMIAYGIRQAHANVVASAAVAAAAFAAAFALLMSDAAWEYVERPPDRWGADWAEPLEPARAGLEPAGEPSMLPGERIDMVMAGSARAAEGVSRGARGFEERG